MQTTAHNRFLIGAFLALLAAVPLLQVAVEARRGERPQVWDVCTQRPTRANLRAFENALEEASVTVRTVRPWIQAAQFLGLREAGDKTLVGRDGWLFYQPGVAFLTQRPQPGDTPTGEALAAIVDFRGQLAARGVRLLLVPAPDKESVYPDKLARRAPPPARVIGPETRAFLAACDRAGVAVVDLFALYRAARARSAAPLYLAQDSHWSPAGARLAAEAVAAHVLAQGWVTQGLTQFDTRSTPVQRHGDLVQLLRAPPLEARLAPEAIACDQVVRVTDGVPYADDPAADVLVLGDSFLRVYARDEPGSAGFVAHLARALGRPLASIVNDGGASTLVRQELCRRPHLLEGKKVVIWEFVERDLRLGMEGWQRIPLPAIPPPAVRAP